MNQQKGFWAKLGQLIDDHYTEKAQRTSAQHSHQSRRRLQRLLRWLTPNGGTLLLVLVMVATVSVWAEPLTGLATVPGSSATTVNYQGRLANQDGTPVADDTYGMSFALYDAATGGNPVWTEDHPSVPVSDSLFSVGLGSKTSGGIPTTTWNGDRYLEITVSGETLSPRELIRSVPIAGMALTVPDGAISTDQIANGAVTSEKLALASASYQSYEPFSTTSADFVPIPEAEVTIDLDTGGKLLIIFASDLHVKTAGNTVEMAVTVDGELQNPPKIEYVHAPANVRVTGSQSLLVDVEAGQHTIALNLRSSDGSTRAYAEHRSLTVLAIR